MGIAVFPPVFDFSINSRGLTAPGFRFLRLDSLVAEIWSKRKSSSSIPGEYGASFSESEDSTADVGLK